jgi:hypothetical protein
MFKNIQINIENEIFIKTFFIKVGAVYTQYLYQRYVYEIS